MNFKKVFIANIIIAFALSLSGFIIDKDPGERDLMLIVFEIAMMTILLFAAISLIFFTVHFGLKYLKKFLVKNRHGKA